MQQQQVSPPLSSSTSFLLILSKPQDHITLSFLFIATLVSLLFLSFSLSSPSPPLSFSTSRHLLSSSSLPSPPSLAYLLTGSSGDSRRLFRLLLALYHPSNTYLLHLDLIADQKQREDLARRVQAVPLFRSAANVHVIGNADFAYKRGSSALSALLHGAALLLKLGSHWDWFLNLDIADYPLLPQDDLLHVFSFLPRELNFVQHSSHIGWRESHTLKPIIVDPGLYLSSKAEMFYATQKRDFPNAYKLFTGSSSVILSREFIEYSILGADNLPRTLLMYYSNTPYSHTAYFQTLLCNSPEFNRTIINDHLHFMKWDTPVKREPHSLSLHDLNNMTRSGAAFGTGFSKKDTRVLDVIDRELLNRKPGNVVPGGWCLGDGPGDGCTLVAGAADVLKPGAGAGRLVNAIVQMIADGSYHSNQCMG